jgi:hypothetical protein
MDRDAAVFIGADDLLCIVCGIVIGHNDLIELPGVL